MNDETYVNTQQQVLLLAKLLYDMPLDEFVRAIRRAETLGPILDPTLFIRAGSTLAKIEVIASALLKAQTEIKPIYDELEDQRDHQYSA